MSANDMAKVLDYLSAISREVGEFRQEFKGFRDRTETRLGNIEGRLDKIEGRLDNVEGKLDKIEGRLVGVEGRLAGVEGRLAGVEQEQRQTRQFMDRLQGTVRVWRGEAVELRERVEVLEKEKG